VDAGVRQKGEQWRHRAGVGVSHSAAAISLNDPAAPNVSVRRP
jgi:hypothetical protein